MKFKKAYNKIIKDECEFLCAIPEDQRCPDACEWRAMLYALKKQIPYKPSTDGLKVGVGRCKCGVEFLDKTTKYCGNCGQALDWGDHDE